MSIMLRLQLLWEKSFIRKGIYMFGIFVIFSIVMDMLVMPFYTKHGEAIELPDVTRKLYAEARAELEGKGFEIIRAEERFDSKYPSGYVLEQNPKQGSAVKSGRRVYVIISRGDRKFEMPTLVDISERDAKLRLSKLGLIMGEKLYESSNYYPEGVIMHQSIPNGVEVGRGTRVDLTISIGSIDDEIVVPSVEGKSLDKAREILARVGIKTGTVSYEVMTSLLPETVIKQSFKAETKIDKEEKIDLVVSRLGDN